MAPCRALEAPGELTGARLLRPHNRSPRNRLEKRDRKLSITRANSSSSLAQGLTPCVAPVSDPLTGNLYSNCTVRADGTARCGGQNNYAQLGDNTTTKRLTPVQVLNVNNARTVVLGDRHGCALLVTGQIRCWGYNAHGQLGDGTTTARNAGVFVSGITNAVELVAGRYHTCARLADGQMRCWGYNGYGGLGNGTTTNATTPVSPSLNGAQVASIAAGYYHTCAALTSGFVRCWGHNVYGQVGNGTTNASGTTQVLTPVSTINLQNVRQVFAAKRGYYTCAILGDGTARCWGINSYGGLGDGTTTQRTSPVAVLGLTGVQELEMGNSHTCARDGANDLYCWGRNNYYQVGDGTTTTRTSPVRVTSLGAVNAHSVGIYHTCARVAATGEIQCWGYNAQGQLGDGTTTNRAAPVLSGY